MQDADPRQQCADRRNAAIIAAIFRTVSAEMSKLPMTDMKARVTPKGQTRQIAGTACAVHDIEVTVPFDMGGEKELEHITKANVDAIDEALKRKEAELLEV